MLILASSSPRRQELLRDAGDHIRAQLPHTLERYAFGPRRRGDGRKPGQQVIKNRREAIHVGARRQPRLRHVVFRRRVIGPPPAARPSATEPAPADA